MFIIYRTKYVNLNRHDIYTCPTTSLMIPIIYNQNLSKLMGGKYMNKGHMIQNI